MMITDNVYRLELIIISLNASHLYVVYNDIGIKKSSSYQDVPPQS